MKLSHALVVTGVGWAGLIVAACGREAEALSRPEFVEQADAVCQATSDEVTPIFEQFWAGFAETDFDAPETQDQFFTALAGVMSDVETRYRHQLDRLRDLVPPEEDEATIASLLDDFEAGLDEMVELADAGAAGDDRARAALEDANPFDDVNQRARQYGLVVCGAEDT